ncbi:MAG: PEGA domain-containing protein, partial [Polyangiaceae bacterium]
VVLSLSSRARAAEPTRVPPPPAYVIPFASDDAEENADAFTGAFRARVRAAAGWSLGESSDALELYTTALRCPDHPDAPCLERIASSLKTNRFFWGYVKKTQPGEVLAEVHLWRKDKGDAVVTQPFSENLKDQNDEVLRRIAEHAFARLAGETVPALLTVSIRPHDVEGTIVVDGVEAATIDEGAGSIELKPGPHVVAVKAKGYKTSTNRVSIDPGKEVSLAVKLEPGTDEPAPPPSKPISAKKILGIGSLVLAGGFAIAGTIETANFFSLKSQNSDDVQNVHTENFCDGGHQTACNTLKQAKTARILSVVFYGVAGVAAGTGAVLLLTDHSGDEPAADKKTAWRISPDVGPGVARLDFSLRF